MASEGPRQIFFFLKKKSRERLLSPLQNQKIRRNLPKHITLYGSGKLFQFSYCFFRVYFKGGFLNFVSKNFSVNQKIKKKDKERIDNPKNLE